MNSLSNIKLERFVRHLSLASKRIEERKNARKELTTQLTKVKKVSLAKPRKSIVEKELKELEDRIARVLETESKIMQRQEYDESQYDVLKKKLAVIEERLGSYLTERGERRKRVTELEEKIRKSAKNKEIALIESQLNDMEKKYIEFKKKGYNKNILNKIKSRIDSLKARLADKK